MFKQKFYATMLFAITILLCSKGVGSLAIITIPASIYLFFSKHNYIY